jgi:hypothetical protein
MHMFLPDANGGVLEIVVHDMDQAQISLVRSHLLQEAAKFTSGNYWDPTYIHGKTMPGLDRLQSGALRVSVRYFETSSGAAITFSSTDRANWQLHIPASGSSPQMTFTTIDGRDFTEPAGNARDVTVTLSVGPSTAPF